MKSFKLFDPNKVANRILYHRTTPQNADSILRYGFDPSKSKYDGKLHLTHSFQEASKYSKIANNGKLGTILAVHQDYLNPEHIDKDDSGIVHYSGPIPKEHVRKFL